MHTDGEGTINNMGSIKGVLKSYLKANKSLIARDLLRCKKLLTDSSNDLKQAAESLPMPFKVVHFESSSEMLDAKLGINMLKEKSEKLHLNQKHNKNMPKGADESFEL